MRLCLVPAVLAGWAALPIVAHAQLYDPQEDSANGTAAPNGQRAAAQQAATRDSSTSQLGATTPPVAQFRADDITSNTRARTETRSASPEQEVGDRPRDRKIVASEFETYVSVIADKPLLRFGSKLLVPNARGFTAPPTTAVPTDYRLNPGDELIVGITGSIQADNLRVTVNPEGQIFIPHVGAVTVGGVRYGDVNRVVSAQVARQFRDFRVAIAIGQLQGITIYVTGFAATPGSYTVSSLSTLVNGVLAAGGPTPGGSFRSIQLKRGGRTISTFDLYDLLLRGDTSADVILQNGDVIYIAPAGPEVAAIGSINNEAIFEAKPGETLADVLRDAGGVSTVAEDTRVLVLDSFQTQTMGWTEVSADILRTQLAKRGEVMRVLSGIGLAGPLRQQSVLVTVSGEVARPGRYFLAPGVTIADAVSQAGGLTAQAFPFATVFTRESVRLQQRIAFQRAVADLQFLLTAQPLTSALADVSLQPARMQAISAVVAQLEARKPDGRLIFDIGPTSAALPGAFALENNDTVLVPPVPVTVGVFGAVPSPNTFTFSPGTTIASYLARAGGVQKVGDAGRVFVVRANGALLVLGRKTSGKAVLTQPALPGDLVFVPINANRGEFFAKIRELTGTLFTAALGTAAISSVAR